MKELIQLTRRIGALEQRLDAAEELLDLVADATDTIAEEVPHITVLMFLWENGLPDDSGMALALIRLAGRYSHESGIPIGYQNEPDLAGEGLTFRRDLFQRAAEELGYIKPSNPQ